jgi:hypothetical protein
VTFSVVEGNKGCKQTKARLCLEVEGKWIVTSFGHCSFLNSLVGLATASLVFRSSEASCDFVSGTRLMSLCWELISRSSYIVYGRRSQI